MDIGAILLRLIEIDNYHATSSRLEQIRGGHGGNPSGQMLSGAAMERVRLAPYRALLEHALGHLTREQFLVWLAMEIGLIRTESGEFVFFDPLRTFRPNDKETGILYNLPYREVQRLFRESRGAVLDLFYSSQLYPPFDRQKAIEQGHRKLLSKLKERDKDG